MKTKSFDCVKMKEECQRAVEKKYAGLTIEERNERMMDDIMADPEFAAIFGRFFEKGSVLKAAEARPEYKAGT